MISRWEPTSQTCCCCGFKDGQLDLSICEWECCTGAKHGRVGSGRSVASENVARNIFSRGWACRDKKWTGRAT